MERSKRKSPAKRRFPVPVSPGKMGTICKGDFRLDRSIPRSPGSGLQQRHSSTQDRPGRTLLNTYMRLRDPGPSLAQFCPAKAAVCTPCSL